MNKLIILLLLLILFCTTFSKSSREGICVVPLNPGLCALPGAIEANKVMAMGHAYDLMKGVGPPAWHDPEIRF